MGPPLSLIVGGKPGKAVHGVWKKNTIGWYGMGVASWVAHLPTGL